MLEADVKTEPFVVRLDPNQGNYLPILKGPPRNFILRSGLAVLQPGESVGVHNTKDYEELVIVLEGQGEMRITSSPALAIGKGLAAYCPPQTEHDVVNTGLIPLRYVYIVANTVGR